MRIARLRLRSRVSLAVLGPREAGELLHQSHEVLRVRVDDLRRVGVDDDGVPLLLMGRQRRRRRRRRRGGFG